jgi:DNA mismatch repair protein MutL
VARDAVDVNVHPRKMEVRFDDETAVTGAVESAVREALLDAGLLRSSAPRGRSQPAEADVRPETGERANDATGADESSEADRGGRDASDADAVDVGNASDRTDAGERDDRVDERDDPSRDWVVDRGTTPERNWQVRETDAGDGSSWPEGDDSDDETTDSLGEGSDAPAGSSETNASAEGATGEVDGAAEWRDETASSVRGPTTQRTLTGDEATPETSFDRLPDLRVLGQLHDTYVVAETAAGLVLVDQHAADERVNYERLQSDLGGDAPTQALADPVDLELTAREAALFEEYADALAELGFRAERVGDRTVEVGAVPAVFDATLDPDLLRDALTAFVDDARDGSATVEAVADSILADLACYPSITGNTSLHEGSVVELLEALDACENPWACPHGRPVIVQFDSEEIRDRFERDYPGHAGRRDEA